MRVIFILDFIGPPVDLLVLVHFLLISARVADDVRIERRD
jgi:hypothetical protein